MADKIKDNATKTHLRELASKLQNDFDLQKRRADTYGARLYDINHPLGDPPPTSIEIKQENTFIKDQNAKLIHELKKYKGKAREARAALNSLKDVILKLKNIEFNKEE